MAKSKNDAANFALATAQNEALELRQRNAALEARAARYREAQNQLKKDASEALTKVKSELKERAAEVAKTALEQPLTDAVLETVGIVAEAVAQAKRPDLAKYAPAVSVVGEIFCTVQAAKPKQKAEERQIYRALSSGFRGVRARATVAAADKMVASILS